MNNELIERTSRAIASCKGDAPILKAVLLDCRKEIERLTIENANYVQALKCINELEAKPSIDALIAEIDKLRTLDMGDCYEIPLSDWDSFIYAVDKYRSAKK